MRQERNRKIHSGNGRGTQRDTQREKDTNERKT